MIQLLTKVKCIDNTGVKQLKCIGILNKKKVALIGDIIIGVITKNKPKSQFKKGQIFRALITTTIKKLNRIDGTQSSFKKNTVILINLDLSPKGTRILEPIAQEIKNLKCPKIIAIAKSFK